MSNIITLKEYVLHDIHSDISRTQHPPSGYSWKASTITHREMYFLFIVEALCAKAAAKKVSYDTSTTQFISSHTFFLSDLYYYLRTKSNLSNSEESQLLHIFLLLAFRCGVVGTTDLYIYIYIYISCVSESMYMRIYYIPTYDNPSYYCLGSLLRLIRCRIFGHLVTYFYSVSPDVQNNRWNLELFSTLLVREICMFFYSLINKWKMLFLILIFTIHDWTFLSKLYFKWMI